jgi:hypothetical protein
LFFWFILFYLFLGLYLKNSILGWFDLKSRIANHVISQIINNENVPYNEQKHAMIAAILGYASLFIFCI